MTTFELPSLRIAGVFARTVANRVLLINRDPAPLEVGVPLHSTIALELVDLDPAGIDRGATRVWVDDAEAFIGGTAPELQPPYAGTRARVEEGTSVLRIVLDPVVPLASQATIRVRVVTQTVGSAERLDETYEFIAEDRTAPRLVAAQAIGQKRLRLVFDEVIGEMDVARLAFTPLDVPAVRIVAVAGEIFGRVVDVDVVPEMTPDARYQIVVGGAADLAGNSALAPFDRTTFLGFRPPRPKGRRFDLWSMLPKYNRRADVTGDLRLLTACFQDVVDLLLADVDRFEDLFDLERAPEAFVDAMLADLGSPFDFELELLDKRRLTAMLVDLYRQKGTAIGLRNAIRFFLGVEVVAITGLAQAGLTLGESELGVDWELGPSDRFARYAFNIQVDRVLTPNERRRLRSIVAVLKPANTHFVELLEPTTPAFIDDWEIGLSELDSTTVLH